MGILTIKSIIRAIFFALIAIILNAQSVLGNDHRWMVLSSGSGNQTSEAWFVSETELQTFPVFDPTKAEPPISPHKAVSLGLAHLARRYPRDVFVATDICLQRFARDISPSPSTSAKDWVYIITFQYGKNDQFQMVPVLLNGSVLLSDNEK